MSLPVYLYLQLHPAYQSKNEDIYPQSLVLRLLQHPQEEEWSYHVAPEGLQERKDGSVCKALERGRCEVIGSSWVKVGYSIQTCNLSTKEAQTLHA